MIRNDRRLCGMLTVLVIAVFLTPGLVIRAQDSAAPIAAGRSVAVDPAAGGLGSAAEKEPAAPKFQEVTTLDQLRDLAKPNSEAGTQPGEAAALGGFGTAGGGAGNGDTGLPGGGSPISSRRAADPNAMGSSGMGSGMMGAGGGLGSMGRGMGMSGAMMGSAPTPDPRELALGKVRELRSRLNSADEDRPKLESELRQALMEYFIVDMQNRVREIDDIKAKAAEMEAKLQKRLEARNEAVDLQLKLYLHEADGLGFFRSEDKQDLYGGGFRSDSMEGFGGSGGSGASRLDSNIGMGMEMGGMSYFPPRTKSTRGTTTKAMTPGGTGPASR